MPLKILILGILFLGQTSVAWAQKELQVWEQTTRSVERTKESGRALQAGVSKRAAMGTQLELSFPAEDLLPESSLSGSLEMKLLTPQELADLQARMRAFNQFPPGSVPRPEMFQVRGMPPDGGENTYSGTVFRDGGTVYGVVAAHILSENSEDTNRLMRLFFADVWIAGEVRSLVAQVVFVAPGFDLALVKFKPEDAALLEAAELEVRLPQPGEQVTSQGFIRNRKPVTLVRSVVDASAFSMRTTLPWPRLVRGGLCGSSVKNAQGKIIGIHTGSTRKGEDESADVGFVSPAWQIKRMVDAYRNGPSSFTVTCDGKNLFDMQDDEYISKIVLLDEYDQVLDTVRPAFGIISDRFWRKTLQNPLLRRAEITLGRRYFVSEYASYVADETAVRKVSYAVPEGE